MVNLFSFGCHVTDWPSVRTYSSTDCTGGVGETIKRKGGVSQACLGKSTSFPLDIHNMVNWQLSKQDSHWPVSHDHIAGSCVNSHVKRLNNKYGKNSKNNKFHKILQLERGKVKKGFEMSANFAKITKVTRILRNTLCGRLKPQKTQKMRITLSQIQSGPLLFCYTFIQNTKRFPPYILNWFGNW